MANIYNIHKYIQYIYNRDIHNIYIYICIYIIIYIYDIHIYIIFVYI